MSRYLVKTTEGKKYNVEEGESVLDGALGSGLVFNYSCKNGQCGICQAALIEGEVEEIRPQVGLTDVNKCNKFLTCCCKPISDIVIDSEDLSALHGIDIKTVPVRISKINRLSKDIVEVFLRYPKTTVFKFLEGQYVDVIGKNAVRRSYSISSTCLDEFSITLLIKKVEGGALSEYWFNDSKENDLLRIEGPKGTFYLRDMTKQLVFLATGTGISPVLSMLYGLDRDVSYRQINSISVFWGNRESESFFWKDNFEKLKVDFYPVLSKKIKGWAYYTGYVQDVAISELETVSNSHVYACGSNEMIIDAKKVFLDAGLHEKNFYSDAFVKSY